MILVNNRQIHQCYRIRSKETDLYEQLADLWQKDSIRLKQKFLCLNNWISLFKKKNYPGVDLSGFTKNNSKWITDLVVLILDARLMILRNKYFESQTFQQWNVFASEWIKLGKSSLYVGQSNAISWEPSENKNRSLICLSSPRAGTTCSDTSGFWAISYCRFYINGLLDFVV